MKILRVITSLHTGGAEKLMVDSMPKLREGGHDAELLVFCGERTPFYERLEAAGVPIHALGMRRNVYHPSYLWKLFRFLRKHKFDIVQAHNYAPQLFCAICSFFVHAKFCTTEHSTSNRRRELKWYAPIDRLMYSRYEKIICVSETAEANLRTFIGDKSDRILTIPNGIDVQVYASASPADLGLGDDVRTLMQVSGFRPAKDQDTVISALKLLPENIHAVFVGDGERRAECEVLAGSLGVKNRTHFLGVRMDVPNLLKSADIVVLSSHWEGLPRATVEGMAAGKPVVASDVQGICEVVSGAGVLFPEGDGKALAKKTTKLLEDRAFYEKTAQACSERAKDFDISKMLEGYLRVYEALVSSEVSKVA